MSGTGLHEGGFRTRKAAVRALLIAVERDELLKSIGPIPSDGEDTDRQAARWARRTAAHHPVDPRDYSAEAIRHGNRIRGMEHLADRGSENLPGVVVLPVAFDGESDEGFARRTGCA